uniref:Uncharacterized protein n=1 Tax=Anopheles atroparvus TaxID=41427 RepID=A0A182JDG0_ANOAO
MMVRSHQGPLLLGVRLTTTRFRLWLGLGQQQSIVNFRRALACSVSYRVLLLRGGPLALQTECQTFPGRVGHRDYHHVLAAATDCTVRRRQIHLLVRLDFLLLLLLLLLLSSRFLRTSCIGTIAILFTFHHRLRFIVSLRGAVRADDDSTVVVLLETVAELLVCQHFCGQFYRPGEAPLRINLVATGKCRRENAIAAVPGDSCCALVRCSSSGAACPPTCCPSTIVPPISIGSTSTNWLKPSASCSSSPLMSFAISISMSSSGSSSPVPFAASRAEQLLPSSSRPLSKPSAPPVESLEFSDDDVRCCCCFRCPFEVPLPLLLRPIDELVAAAAATTTADPVAPVPVTVAAATPPRVREAN